MIRAVDTGEFELRPIWYLAPMRPHGVVSLGVDWRAEMAWLRELVAETRFLLPNAAERGE